MAGGRPRNDWQAARERKLARLYVLSHLTWDDIKEVMREDGFNPRQALQNEIRINFFLTVSVVKEICRKSSRLCCQMIIQSVTEGIILRVVTRQHSAFLTSSSVLMIAYENVEKHACSQNLVPKIRQAIQAPVPMVLNSLVQLKLFRIATGIRRLESCLA
jgi:hypothetical protein